MKRFFTTCILVLIINSLKAQKSFYFEHDSLLKKEVIKKNVPSISRFIVADIGYEFTSPLGEMHTGMSNIHGIALRGGIPLNFISKSLVLNANLNYGIYGWRNYRVNYRIANNYINTSIDYTSDVTQTGLGLQYTFNEKSKLQPFVTAKGGYTFFSTNFSVNDPFDIDACRALESDNILFDATPFYGFGIGARYVLGEPSKTRREFISLSIEKINGGEIDYVNANSLHDHNTPLANTTAKPVNITFINASSSNTHQHKVAELHTSSLNMLQIKLSYVKYFSIR